MKISIHNLHVLAQQKEQKNEHVSACLFC